MGMVGARQLIAADNAFGLWVDRDQLIVGLYGNQNPLPYCVILRIPCLTTEGYRCPRSITRDVDHDLLMPELIRHKYLPLLTSVGKTIRKDDPLDGGDPAKGGVV